MLPVIAQLVAPPAQPGPVRLPAGGSRPSLPLSVPQPQVEPAPAPRPPVAVPDAGVLTPQIKGFNPYGALELRRILSECLAGGEAGSGSTADSRLTLCATALSARLFADGYINSRVLPRPLPAPGVLEVVPGRIETIAVVSSNRRLQRRLERLLRPLQGRVLHLPSLTASLSRIQQLPGVGLLKSNLNRIAEDSSRAALLVTAEPERKPWQGELALRNDGNGGSGQFRGLATVIHDNNLLDGDNLLLFGEINSDSDPEIGTLNGSLSYTLPLSDRLQLTTAFGSSNRAMVEALPPVHNLSYRQLQLYGQLDYNLFETPRQRWSAFAGFSLNRNDAFLRGERIAAVVGGGDQGWLRTGFLRLGLAYDSAFSPLFFSANLYGLQGISALSTVPQREELLFLGIDPDQSRALGSQLSLSWLAGSRWQLNLRGAAQLAFNPLTNPMGFSLGSDSGLRGLPGQVVSGDSGLLGSLELAWLCWRNRSQALQLVPFIGAGQVWSQVPQATLSDSTGAGGVLLRWSQGRHAELELGWVKQFQGGNTAYWNQWILGSGLYSKVVYRF